MIEQNVLKAFKVLKRNNLNPSEFFVNEQETLTEVYYNVINKNKEKKKEPRAKYIIYCHRKREKSIVYVEDLFAQSDYYAMTIKQIDELFKKSHNKLYCCYDCFLNRLGSFMADGDVDYRDYGVVFYQKGKSMYSNFTRDGYLVNWPIGYFSFND